LSKKIGSVVVKIYKGTSRAIKLFWQNLKECYLEYGKNFAKIVKTHVIDSILTFIGGIGDAIFNSIPVASQLRGAINAILSVYNLLKLAAFSQTSGSSSVAFDIGKAFASSLASSIKSILGFLNIEGIEEIFNISMASIAVGLAEWKK